MANVPGRRAGFPLPPPLLAELRRILDTGVHENADACAEDIGIGKTTLVRAAAGMPLRPASVKVIAMGLAKIKTGGAAA